MALYPSKDSNGRELAVGDRVRAPDGVAVVTRVGSERKTVESRIGIKYEPDAKNGRAGNEYSIMPVQVTKMETSMGIAPGLKEGDRIRIIAPLGTDDEGTVVHISPSGGVGYKSSKGYGSHYLAPEDVRNYRIDIQKMDMIEVKSPDGTEVKVDPEGDEAEKGLMAKRPMSTDCEHLDYNISCDGSTHKMRCLVCGLEKTAPHSKNPNHDERKRMRDEFSAMAQMAADARGREVRVNDVVEIQAGEDAGERGRVEALSGSAVVVDMPDGGHLRTQASNVRVMSLTEAALMFQNSARCPYCSKSVQMARAALGEHNGPGGACAGSGRRVAELDGQGRAVLAFARDLYGKQLSVGDRAAIGHGSSRTGQIGTITAVNGQQVRLKLDADGKELNISDAEFLVKA